MKYTVEGWCDSCGERRVVRALWWENAWGMSHPIVVWVAHDTPPRVHLACEECYPVEQAARRLSSDRSLP